MKFDLEQLLEESNQDLCTACEIDTVVFVEHSLCEGCYADKIDDVYEFIKGNGG